MFPDVPGRFFSGLTHDREQSLRLLYLVLVDSAGAFLFHVLRVLMSHHTRVGDVATMCSRNPPSEDARWIMKVHGFEMLVGFVLMV